MQKIVYYYDRKITIKVNLLKPCKQYDAHDNM